MPLKLNGTNSVAAPAYAGDDADTGLQCGTDELNLVTGGTARVKIASDGAVQLLSSTGIDFSGIQTNASGMTSETLDSYEEGTWTPGYSGATSAGSYTFDVETGLYTKIGNRVTVDFKLANVTTGTAGSGTARITGLPFTVGTTNVHAQGSVRISRHNVADTTIAITLEAIQNTTMCQIILTRDNNSNVAVTCAEKTTDAADIIGSITYNVD